MPEGRKLIRTNGILGHIKDDMEVWIQARSIIVAAAEVVEEVRRGYPRGPLGVVIRTEKLEAALIAAGVIGEEKEAEDDLADRPTDPGTPSTK